VAEELVDGDFVAEPGGLGRGGLQEQPNPCGSCHTLEAAGATGKIGPDLDKLPQYAQEAGQPLEQFIHTSIVDPNAYVQPHYPRNVMPPFASLPKAQLDALVQYLIQSSKRG